MSEGTDKPISAGRPAKGLAAALALTLQQPLDRLVAAVTLLGPLAFAFTLLLFGGDDWPVLAWLAFTLACAVMVSRPYRINRPGESYFLDFDEIVLVVALLYLGPPAVVTVLSIGFLLGGAVRGISARRVLFNSGSRAVAASAAVTAAHLLPVSFTQPWGYVAGALLAAVIYTLVNQCLVARAIALRDGGSFSEVLSDAITGVQLTFWPTVVSYGLVVGVATMAYPGALFLGAIPVALSMVASRISQVQREEHLRMTGLYRAAQEMHEARTDEEIVRILRLAIRKTLGVDGASLRSSPPFGDELGAWLPNRSCWIIVPAPASSATRRQDEAFLQAAASLVESSMERATLVGELERQSLRDPLTNAFNRRYFHQALASALEDRESEGCLALLDIDHFKVINDTFGHEVGDNTLKELVAAADEAFQVSGFLCRLGGDEFALILPGMAPDEVSSRLDALRERLAASRPGGPGRGPRGLHASAGVAAYPEHGREPMDLLRAADRALYRAKREGRNRVVVLGSEE